MIVIAENKTEQLTKKKNYKNQGKYSGDQSFKNI